MPRSESPKTAIAKAVKKGQVKEQPPTRRAFIGKQPKPKVTIKKGPGGRAEKVIVPMAKTRKPQAKVEKIGAPVWRRQLNWKGEPEKVNIKMYPFKIICAKCGQPRYIDAANAHVKDHPVTLCKPHARREHDDRHNAMLRRRTAEKREAALKAAKLACKALPKPAGKAPGSLQAARSGKKGTTIPPKGPYKGKKARGRSEG